jgi:hypothetical protein
MSAHRLVVLACRKAPLLALALATAAAFGLASDRAGGTGSILGHVRAGNGGTPFAGDRSNFVTVSPNGDGRRDSAHISFRLSRPAGVTLRVLVDGGRARPPQPIFTRSRSFAEGPQRIRWNPTPELEPRTYIVQLLVNGSQAASLVVRVLAVEAGFTRQSYRPNARATLVVSSDARRLALQLYQAGPERMPNLYAGYGNDSLFGIPVGKPSLLDWSHDRSDRRVLHVHLPGGPTGFYFARLETGDGRVGFAPFVLLPRRFGDHRIAVVFPTNTWQAYNHRDVDGDGRGDTWYAVDSIERVDVTRPYLHRGVPTRFRGYEVGFLRWLYYSDKQVDFITDRQLDRLSAERLQRLYDLIVFLGHHEYMTTAAYDAAVGYRDLAGNLLFTSTTNFLYRVEHHGHWLIRTQPWRAIGRPESGLIGVQYLQNDDGEHQGHYLVVGAEAAPWAFRGTGMRDGDSFGHGGIEIDARTAASPRGTIVLATMPNLQGPGYSAEMTYYSTRAGAKVFAAGTLNFAGTALEPPVSALLENVWRQLARP